MLAWSLVRLAARATTANLVSSNLPADVTNHAWPEISQLAMRRA
ncbi:excision endonuclease subunit UvrD domain protein [Mycobacterium kansasii 662]|uniref:Excision endonuclease subunit UvrD domain protein n=1 Tax=Mycobacterium kansasii 662 TaxID=1299326 RepID=X7XQJ2_MYCKA|nr:excision endonuclease subunit UvrD domain protein [Mycobacterium kansasii 662]